ncbi:hypothetical protein SAMN03080601_01943 [Alkalitalea saponilacus]|uniref:Uncharacterized protein n=1 Tax=Alkalitalea saponilacus TaxID=889453 RepID=A0A1T5GS88_9BACT|nr:hypothetical protein SAMN03080601_01943 [Alkalitalea saponilacus]
MEFRTTIFLRLDFTFQKWVNELTGILFCIILVDGSYKTIEDEM